LNALLGKNPDLFELFLFVFLNIALAANWGVSFSGTQFDLLFAHGLFEGERSVFSAEHANCKQLCNHIRLGD
jgi:hypothetical protein